MRPTTLILSYLAAVLIGAGLTLGIEQISGASPVKAKPCLGGASSIEAWKGPDGRWHQTVPVFTGCVPGRRP